MAFPSFQAEKAGDPREAHAATTTPCDAEENSPSSTSESPESRKLRNPPSVPGGGFHPTFKSWERWKRRKANGPPHPHKSASPPQTAESAPGWTDRRPRLDQNMSETRASNPPPINPSVPLRATTSSGIIRKLSRGPRFMAFLLASRGISIGRRKRHDRMNGRSRRSAHFVPLRGSRRLLAYVLGDSTM